MKGMPCSVVVAQQIKKLREFLDDHLTDPCASRILRKQISKYSKKIHKLDGDAIRKDPTNHVGGTQRERERTLAAALEQQKSVEDYVLDTKTKVHLMAEGASTYFEKTIIGKLEDDLQIYDACRLVNPIFMRKRAQPNLDYETCFKNPFLEDLKKLTFVHQEQQYFFFFEGETHDMISELPRYRSLINQFPAQPEDDDLAHQIERTQEFWSRHCRDLPKLSRLIARYAFTLTPSSAGAERVFSMMKNYITKAQMAACLAEYSETTVMLGYNYRGE